MLDRLRHIRVVADDQRVLASELEADFREHAPFADGFLNQLAGGGGPRETDNADAVVAHERQSDVGTSPLQGRIKATRQAGFKQQFAERHSGIRRQLV